MLTSPANEDSKFYTTAESLVLFFRSDIDIYRYVEIIVYISGYLAYTKS